jgi:hypothetical protein
MKNAGVDMSLYPQWQGYGRWLLSALTPAEPRFGNPRKMVSLGDGNTEATPMHGMVATLLRSTNPSLSSQLQWGWLAQGQPYGEFTAPSMLVIDPNAPSTNPNLQSADYLGYWSVFRHGFGTPRETALWFVNGNFYSDHRHADSGQVTIYAHSAPLAIDWNPNLYYPHVGGGIQHNRVVRESEIGQPWNADNLSLDAVGNWGAAQGTQFSAFQYSTEAETPFLGSDGTTWTRNVTMLAPDLSYPVIYVRDHFSGAGSNDSKVLTWNLMAQGAVSTPAGSYTPIPRFNSSGSSTPNALPSNGPDYALSSGLQHFLFTGQTWPAHPTKGIDWDLFLIPDSPQRFYIGSWGDNQQSSTEASQFQKTNGTPFQESQYILRVQGAGSFSTLILPYRKGEAPSRSVRQAACGILISQFPETLCFSEAAYQFSDGRRRILTTFNAQPAQFEDLSISGGPTEVVATSDEVRITASGSSGVRSITVPGTWTDPVTLVLTHPPVSPRLPLR